LGDAGFVLIDGFWEPVKFAAMGSIHARINKGTLWLTKREEGWADQFWIRLHFSEDAGQGGEEFGLGGKVAIVGSVLSGVLP
jgi:hypothetical protein